MTSFEDRLWGELSSEYATELALGGPSAPRGRGRLVTFAVAAAVVAAVAVAITVGFKVGSSTPAYAVTQNSNGTVTVAIRELVGIKDANAKLAALGVRARVAAVEAGCTANQHAFDPIRIPIKLVGTMLSIGPGSSSAPLTITPSVIPTGDTLLITANQIAPTTATLAVRLYRGATPPCVPPTAGGSIEKG